MLSRDTDERPSATELLQGDLLKNQQERPSATEMLQDDLLKNQQTLKVSCLLILLQVSIFRFFSQSTAHEFKNIVSES